MGSDSQTDSSNLDSALMNPELANVTRLIRVVAMFVAWPSLSIGLAFIVFEGINDHWEHVSLVPLGLAACVVFGLAPRIAARFVAR